jgi:hypothetical protein
MTSTLDRLPLQEVIHRRLETQLKGILSDANEIYQLIVGQAGYEDLCWMLEGFTTFSQDYCDFITRTNDLFDEKIEIRFTRHHQALEKILREWLSLRPMLMQQLAMSHMSTGTHLMHSLQIADDITKGCIRLNNHALSITANKKISLTLRGNQRVKKQGKEQQPRTYFQKSYTISRFAYSQRVPAIAIPLDVWHEPWHWMGLAHEVGHYVFWNLELRDENGHLMTDENGKPATVEQRLKTTMRNQLWDVTSKLEWEESDAVRDLWRSWVEEVFSDIYGALILGPAYIESLIAWLAPQGGSEALYANDEDHPTPILRPLLQIAALKALNPQATTLNADLDALATAWEAYCKAFTGNADLFDAPIGNVSAAHVAACIDIIAQTVVDIFKNPDGTPLPQLYDENAHAEVIAAAQSLATGNNPAPLSRKELPLAVSWYAWSYRMAANQTDMQPIRSWLGLSALRADKIAPTDERVFIDTFLPEKVKHLTTKLDEYVQDVLVNSSDLRTKYDRKPAYLNNMLEDVLAGEFSTEEGGNNNCSACGFVNCPGRRNFNGTATQCYVTKNNGKICGRYYTPC